ncbi:MAG: hypothetical protein GWO24_00340, partial [Akkermansiaceae bacterium]|nr:hypothetical protein [Akkermansiaceae bacterium]
DYDHEIEAGQMNRLYMVETAYSLTGGMADHRLRVAPSRIFKVAAAVAKKIEAALPDGAPGKDELRKITVAVPPISLEEKKALLGGDDKAFDQWIRGCADDLLAAAGEKGAVVLAGSRQGEGVHRLAVAMNAALGAYGGGALTVVRTGRLGYHDIDQLVEDLDRGTVDTVILLGPSNPVYDLPADVEFAKHLAKAKLSIHLGLRTDATAKVCSWHVPAAHYLESWSDARSATGVYSLVQPMILPLYGGLSELEFLSQLLAWKEVDWTKVESGEAEAPVLLSGEGAEGAASVAYHEVRKTFAELGEDGDTAWKEAL